MSFHKSYQLILSPKAQQDFIDILRYTNETWGEQQLQLYRDKIDDALKSIGSNPQLGHNRNDLPRANLAYLVAVHAIIYRICQNRVEIVRILHQRMSLGKHIKNVKTKNN